MSVETEPTGMHDSDGASDEARAEATGAEAQSEETARLHEEINRLNDRLLRLAAELENTRRRAEREKADAGRYAIASFARDLLPLADNFERALATVGGGGQDALASLVEGVQLIEREFARTLERHGVRRVDAAGEKFDPNLHLAVAQAPSADIAAGHVAEVAQPGYVIGERVLRAAMVVVSSGAADSPPSAPGETVDTLA